MLLSVCTITDRLETGVSLNNRPKKAMNTPGYRHVPNYHYFPILFLLFQCQNKLVCEYKVVSKFQVNRLTTFRVFWFQTYSEWIYMYRKIEFGSITDFLGSIAWVCVLLKTPRLSTLFWATILSQLGDFDFSASSIIHSITNRDSLARVQGCSAYLRRICF